MAMAANYNCPLPISFWRAKFPHFWMRWPVVWRKENVCLMHLGLLNSTIRFHALCFILLLKVKKNMGMISWQWMWQYWHFMVGNLLTQWGVCSWGAWLLWSWVYGLQSWIPAGNERLTDGMTVGVTVKIVIAAGSKVLTPDIRSTKLLDWDIIVLHKWTFNLSDLTGLWKKIMLK